MFLRWLSRLLASLLVPLLFAATFALVLEQTVLNPPYLTHQLQANDAYTKLTTALNKQIVDGNSNNSNVPQADITAKLATIITPAVLQQKLDSTITQVKTYYNGEGPLPTLDISDIAVRLQSAGVQLPKKTDYTKPIALTQLSVLKTVHKQVNNGKLAAVGAIVLLTLGIVAIALRTKNYKPLANVFISLGVLLAMSGVALLLVQRLTNHFVPKSTADLTGLARDLANSVSRDIGKRLLVAAAAALLVGIAGRIIFHKIAKGEQAGPTSKLPAAALTDNTLPVATPEVAGQTPSTDPQTLPKPKRPKLIQ